MSALAAREPWLVVVCAGCARCGRTLYRTGGRASAAIAQGRASGWTTIGELAVCPSYDCQALAARWRALDVAAEIGSRVSGPSMAQAATLRKAATVRQYRARYCAPWWVRAIGWARDRFGAR